jgi:hypothetical protein
MQVRAPGRRTSLHRHLDSAGHVAEAEAVIQGPDAIRLVECGLHSQAYIADGASAGYLGGAAYYSRSRARREVASPRRLTSRS